MSRGEETLPQVSPKTPAEPGQPQHKERPAPEPRTGLRVADEPQRSGLVRIRVKKPWGLQAGVRLRIAKPIVKVPRLLAWPRNGEVSLLIAPAELSLAVSRAGGDMKSQKRFSARLPRRAIKSAMQAGNVQEPDVIVFALKRMWHETRLGPRNGQAISLIIPDQCVRMIALPLEGRGPRPPDGDAMARWALRKVLRRNVDNYRIDWTVLTKGRQSQESDWFFAVAAEVGLVREYERLVERLGLSVGRVLPVTLAAAASAHRKTGEDPTDARLVLCGTGRRPAALLEANGIPRIHRAWRTRVVDMEAELRAIDTYARHRQGLNIVEALVVGPPRWTTRMARTCEQMGYLTTSRSRWHAHRGAVT
jgi:hypothetical protein